jgi:hypothetical protein
VNIPFARHRAPNDFDYINATDDLELTIIPHQIIIQLLQGPSKTEFKLRLLDHNFDLILQKICFYMQSPVPQVHYKQKFIYKFIISLIPFIFEKVKNIECSYLMLHCDEIELLVHSEMKNYLEMLAKGIASLKQVADTRTAENLLTAFDGLLDSVREKLGSGDGQQTPSQESSFISLQGRRSSLQKDKDVEMMDSENRRNED